MLLKLKTFFEKFKGILRTNTAFSEKVRQFNLKRSALKSKKISTKKVVSTTNVTKIEFPKLIIMILAIFAIIWINWYFLLVTIQVPTNDMGTVVVSILEKVVNVILVYFLYQGWMKNSRNKYGIDTDGIPYSIKASYSEIFEESPPSDSETNEGEMNDSDELSE